MDAKELHDWFAGPSPISEMDAEDKHTILRALSLLAAERERAERLMERLQQESERCDKEVSQRIWADTELQRERERADRNQEDAERWRIARQRFVAFDWSWNSPPIPVGIFHLPEVREVRAGPEGADAAIDAARRK